MKASRLLDELFGDGALETPGMRMQARIYVGFLLTSTVAWCWRWAAEMARFRDVIRPHGLAHYLDVHFLFGPLAYVNAALVSVSALLGACRVSPRLGYSLALLGFHVQCVARYSQGKLCHGASFVGLGMLALCAAAWIFQHGRDRRAFAMGASVFLIGLAYVSAATSKLVNTGPSWVDGRHMWLWIGEKSVDALAAAGGLELSWLQRRVLESRALATAILTAGLCTELCGVLLWFRVTRAPVALAFVGMHAGIYLTMGILFDANVIMLMLLALPWHRPLDALYRASIARGFRTPVRQRPLGAASRLGEVPIERGLRRQR